MNETQTNTHNVYVSPATGATQVCYVGGLVPSVGAWDHVYSGVMMECQVFARAWRDGWVSRDGLK